MNFWTEVTQGLEQMIRTSFQRLPYFTVALIIFLLLCFIGSSLRGLIQRLCERRRRRHNVGLVLGRLIHGLSVFAALLVAASIAIPSFQPGQLVQLLGIGSVAIGFAFRDIFQNFLAGILVLLTEPFQISDQITVQDYEGTVEDIQTRATMIRTYDGRRIVIPNATLFTNPVTVHTAFEKRRVEYEVGIGYGDDPERAKQLMLEALRSVKEVLDEPAPDVLVVGLGASTVDLRARWWVQPPRRSETNASRDQVLLAIRKQFTEHGIDLAFPTQQVLFHDQTEESDGDRSRQREGWPQNGKNVPAARTIAGALHRLGDLLETKGLGQQQLSAAEERLSGGRTQST